MNGIRRNEGLSLVEFVIAVMIAAILASLAFPRFWGVVEFSRSSEALANISEIRKAVERCYLMKGGDYNGCYVNELDVSDPSLAPEAHFTYYVDVYGANGFFIKARRSETEGGNTNDYVMIIQDNGQVSRLGTGSFIGVK